MHPEFEEYLVDLAHHEQQKSLDLLEGNPHEKIKIFSGHRLNWLGDFFGNPEIKWEKILLNIDDIRFTGTAQELNPILKDKCQRQPAMLRELINLDEDVRKIIENHATFSDELIVVRNEPETGKFLMLDGTHRLLGMILQYKTHIFAWYPKNEFELLSHCEAHVMYDLIRGYLRNAQDEQGKTELYHGLKLLARTYGNVKDLLKHRFDPKHVSDPEVQKIIEDVLGG
jgi:hypothetical protein